MTSWRIRLLSPSVAASLVPCGQCWSLWSSPKLLLFRVAYSFNFFPHSSSENSVCGGGVSCAIWRKLKNKKLFMVGTEMCSCMTNLETKFNECTAAAGARVCIIHLPYSHTHLSRVVSAWVQSTILSHKWVQFLLVHYHSFISRLQRSTRHYTTFLEPYGHDETFDTVGCCCLHHWVGACAGINWSGRLWNTVSAILFIMCKLLVDLWRPELSYKYACCPPVRHEYVYALYFKTHQRNSDKNIAIIARGTCPLAGIVRSPPTNNSHVRDVTYFSVKCARNFTTDARVPHTYGGCRPS